MARACMDVFKREPRSQYGEFKPNEYLSQHLIAVVRSNKKKYINFFSVVPVNFIIKIVTDDCIIFSLIIV